MGWRSLRRTGGKGGQINRGYESSGHRRFCSQGRIFLKRLYPWLDLSRQKDLPLYLLIAADREEMLGTIQKRNEEICAGQSVEPAMQVIQKLDLSKIASAVRNLSRDPLFIPSEKPRLSCENLQSLISLLNNPLFLVR
jgi:hypothetical protein